MEESITSEFKGKYNIDRDLLNACIHCGLCLPACPTYLATGRELESPRGRIYLLSLLEQGKEPLSQRMVEHLDSCLGCLGCQTACPSGVHYESLFNQSRAVVKEVMPEWLKKVKYFAFKFILPNDTVLITLGNFLRFWQRIEGATKLEFLCRITLISYIPAIKNLLRWQSLIPPLPVHKKLPASQSINSTEDTLSSRLAVAQLFKGCIMDIFYNQVNHAALDLLIQRAKTVSVPEQSCCGALAFHAGEKELACELAKQNIEKFSSTDGPIVVTASGCAAMLKAYQELFAEDDPWHIRAKEFAERIQDLPEFLAIHAVKDKFVPACRTDREGAGLVRIAYHAACHLAHAQGIRLAPKQLLENFVLTVNEASAKTIVQLIPLREEEHCCGSAGIYNITHTTLSEEILQRKIEMIKESGAHIIVTTNPGCLLQLQTGIRKQGLDIKVIHLAELLAKGY